MKYKVFRILLLTALAVGQSVSVGAAELRALGLAASSKGAEVSLELAGSTREHLSTLEHPHRTVIDLPHTALARGVRLPDASGLISDIRVGSHGSGTLRLVLVLNRAAPAHAVWVRAAPAGRHRLIITLGEPGSEVGDATLRVVRAAHAPAEDDRDVIVAVDAGHGGHDPGAIGHFGTREKDVTLAIARVLAERISAEPGMRAVLTRNRDEFVLLRDRIGRARLAKADMFISVHADSIADRTVSGASVYVLSERGATNEAARWLAERENAADLMGGVRLGDKDSTLQSVLLDVAQSANISASMTAAHEVLTNLDEVGEVRKSAVQQAGFVVLKSPDIPSMLVETAYISNPQEERNLTSARHQSRLAEAIFAGVRLYFEHNPPSGTHFAQLRRNAVASTVTPH